MSARGWAPRSPGHGRLREPARGVDVGPIARRAVSTREGDLSPGPTRMETASDVGEATQPMPCRVAPADDRLPGGELGRRRAPKRELTLKDPDLWVVHGFIQRARDEGRSETDYRAFLEGLPSGDRERWTEPRFVYAYLKLYLRARRIEQRGVRAGRLGPRVPPRMVARMEGTDGGASPEVAA